MRRGQRRRREENVIEDSCAKLRTLLGDNDTVPRSITFTQGTPVDINTNVYKMSLTSQSTIYQYDVSMEPEILSPRLITHFLYQALFPNGGSMSSNKEWSKIIFDQQKIVYSPRDDLAGEFDVKPRKDTDKLVKVKITQTRAIPADDIESFIAFSNTSMKQSYRALGLKSFRRKWLDESKSQQTRSFNIIQGIVPSILSLSGGLSYVVDTATRIDRAGSLYDFLKEGRSHPQQQKFLLESIKSMQIQTTHRLKPKAVTISSINWDKYPSNYTFSQEDRKTKNVRTISIAQYYHEAYNKDLPNDDVIVEMTTRSNGEPRTIAFPASVLKLSGISDAERRMPGVMSEIANVTRVKPQDRKRVLDDFVKKLKTTPESSQFLNTWGFDIGNSTKVQGHIIDPPSILVQRNGKTVPVRLNETLKFTQMKDYSMYRPVDFNQPILFICPEENRMDFEKRWHLDFSSVAKGLGIKLPQFDNNRHVMYVKNTHGNDYNICVKNYIQNVQDQDLPKFVVCILPSAEKQRYDKIKHFLSVELGLPSQCVTTNAISKGKSVWTNVAIQIASKLGGVSFRVDLKIGRTVVIGLSLSSNLGSSPVCAGTVSFDTELTQFYSNARALQRGDNIIPADFIDDLVRTGLTKFHERNGKYPRNVIVYREGVSYGMMPKLKNEEVPAISSAINDTVGNEETSFIYMIAQKRGSIRILRQHDSNRFDNACAGTVITDEISIKDVAEFYMVSHHANQGSATPTRYTIIHKSCENLSDDKLIQLTHFQTLQYPNWSGSIRIPACLMLASRLSEMSKSHLGSDNAKEQLSTFLHFL